VSALGYWLLWIVFYPIARVGFRLRVRGREHIPATGPLIIASNHASYLDIPFLGVAVTRRLRYLGRQDLFAIPGARWILRRLGWIPIRLDRLDRVGFGQAVTLLQNGQAVVIFPEGTRTQTGTLQTGKPGIGTLIAETKSPVVPAYIAGSYEAWPQDRRWFRFRPVTVTFGAPMEFGEELGRLPKKEFYRSVSRSVMTRIAELGQVSPPPEHRAGPSAAQR
jgi:1-acyl-sn-glycerol-3-phosphate acyltransferase